jgi:hypothetical protein
MNWNHIWAMAFVNFIVGLPFNCLILYIGFRWGKASARSGEVKS